MSPVLCLTSACVVINLICLNNSLIEEDGTLEATNLDAGTRDIRPFKASLEALANRKESGRIQPWSV